MHLDLRTNAAWSPPPAAALTTKSERDSPLQSLELSPALPDTPKRTTGVFALLLIQGLLRAPHVRAPTARACVRPLLVSRLPALRVHDDLRILLLFPSEGILGFVLRAELGGFGRFGERGSRYALGFACVDHL